MRHLVFPGCVERFPVAADLPVRVSLVSYPTEDGLTLTGAWIVSEQPGSRTAIFFHGNRDSAAMNVPFGSALAALGVNVFLAEYRGYGGMPGKPSEQGLYRDGMAALEAVRARGVEARDVALVGRSLGSGVAVELAHRGLGRALVLISPYTSIVDVARRRRGGFLAPLLIRDRFDSRSKIGAVSIPTVVFHGTADPVVPFAHGQALAAAAPNGRLVPLEGQPHRIDLVSLAAPIAGALV